jgi:hypothetical protein
LTIPVVFAGAAVMRKRPGLALFPVVFVVLAFVGMALTYWIGTIPIEFWISTSAERIAVSLVVVPALILPLLLAEAVVPEVVAAPLAGHASEGVG